MKYEEIVSLAARMTEGVGRVLVGCEKQLELITAAMLAGGHVLLEDVPGTGKTTLARSLAAVMGCGMARVQFTPDLLPADITGTRVWDQSKGCFSFVRGPVFTSVLLADEINRATPRTQSALLECMEEKQVTEGGVTYALPRPFFVIATQNPIETQGTFPLPEAQLDRFLVRLSLGYPSTEQSFAMLRRFDGSAPAPVPETVTGADTIMEAAALCRTCHVSDSVLRYLIALCEAARDPAQVRLGPSPRAELMMMRMAQSLAAIRGRDYVIPDDLRELALPVLGHRVILRGMLSRDSSEFLRDVLQKVPVPTEDAL